MGVEYLLVHVKYTIPPALLLTLLYRPFQTRLDICRIGFLLGISVLSTTPWDSDLVGSGVWVYPENGVLGYTLFKIPVEEVFFFFIQTYTTTLAYLLCSKQVVHVAYLNEINADLSAKRVRKQRLIGAAVAAGFLSTIFKAAMMVRDGGPGMYMGMLLVWTVPFLLGLWSISYQHILSLPMRTTLLPICVPTVYLWAVDTVELQRGTWTISQGTKLDIQPWPHMEIEEVAFFVLTNSLIVFGLIAFDYAIALMTAFPSLFPDFHGRSPVRTLFGLGAKALCTWSYPKDEYNSITTSVNLLRRKSRSFYLASSVFEGRLRLDLISLYSFCRAADDLIDDSPEPELSLERLRMFLDISYDPARKAMLESFVTSMFPAWAHTPLLSLPSHKLPRALLEELLDGFQIDMQFPAYKPGTKGHASKKTAWPIQAEEDLVKYSYCVAGTVGEMFLHLVFSHSAPSTRELSYFLSRGGKMGIALQYVNIARDIHKDAAMGRVYIPSAWLKEAGLTEEAVLADPACAVAFRDVLLKKAGEMYARSRGAIELLPEEARGGARVAIEGYMDIGRRMEGGCAGDKSWRDSRAARVIRMWKVMRG